MILGVEYLVVEILKWGCLVIMDHVVGGKFKLGRKIGSGSFGELYLGMCLDFWGDLIVLGLFLLLI